MPVDEALIAKLAIFERCTDPTAVTYLYSAINEAPEGKPAILALLEDLREQPDEFKAKCPEPWAPRVDFIREWISLDPLLTGQDLRAAVYLSRETVPLRALRGTLSAAAAEGLRVLLRITSTSSPSGTAAAAAIPGPEMPEVMAALITELRKHGAWKTKPGGFDGALILAEQSPEAGSQLAAFIRTVAPEKLPPWLNILVKGAPWFKAAEKR
jgi:predicted KAP-like P-loop ATPase